MKTLYEETLEQICASFHELPDGPEAKFDQMLPSERLLYMSIALETILEEQREIFL